MPHRMALNGERLYPPYKTAALVDLAAASGLPAAAVLRGTGLDADALRDASCLTSIGQYLRACSNAIGLLADRALSFRAGAALHLSDYGMYGLLQLSCGTLRESVDRAVRYQRLSTPTMAIDAVVEGTQLLWLLRDEVGDLPAELRLFLVEQQAAQQVTHMSDLLGEACSPTLACFAHPAPVHRDRYAELLGCPCVFGWHRHEIRYPGEILARRPGLANPLAATMLESVCDGQLADLEASLGFAGKVYRTLRLMDDPGAGMKAVASMLKMTDRTLRRRLAGEGTSFTSIAHHMKLHVATECLKDSGARIDEVAAVAGFSDPANFRRAFIRWTSMSPAQFRRQQQR